MFQKLKDTTLYYEEYGSGSRIILSMLQVFDPHRKGWPYDLADEGFHVYVIQMRGYGQSEHVFENYGERWYDIWAQDVAEFADAKGIHRFLYTGASDGGGIGWHLCLRYSERLIGFAGLAAGPHSRSIGKTSPSREHAIDSAGSHAAVEQLARYRKQTVLYFADFFPDNSELKKEFEEKAELVYQQKMQSTPEELRIQPGIPLPWLKTDDEVLNAFEEIKFPVLLINGMQDAMLPMRKAILPMGAIEKAKAVFYQEANHQLYYGRRDDVRREIAIFANEIFENEKNKKKD